jgi:hypothetical protein
MRTTLTLEQDVAAMLKRVAAQQKRRLKDVVNLALRFGLAAMLGPRKRKKRFRTKPVALGRCLVGTLDDVAEVLAVAEGDRFK